MLSYEEFKEKLVTEVTVYAPEKYKNAIVDIMGVPKAEGNVDAIIMRMPDRNSGASLNCKDLYADYVKSKFMYAVLVHSPRFHHLLTYLDTANDICNLLFDTINNCKVCSFHITIDKIF